MMKAEIVTLSDRQTLTKNIHFSCGHVIPLARATPESRGNTLFPVLSIYSLQSDIDFWFFLPFRPVARKRVLQIVEMLSGSKEKMLKSENPKILLFEGPLNVRIAATILSARITIIPTTVFRHFNQE